ncbi:MAG: choice-of-anchor tandem repeat GloVer-containing protein [Terriglobales bacterium]
MKHRGNTLSMIAVALLSVTTASAQTYTPLYTYPQTGSGSSGITWPSLLSQGQDGNLYSTIETNGAYNSGSVYKMTTAGVYTPFYSFCVEGSHCASTGGYPLGGVTLGFDGNLWGTTQNGGKYAVGTVFKITSAGTLTNVYSFTNGKDDGVPNYPVFQGQDGNMYGVSEVPYGGEYGAFFKLTTKGKITAKLFDYSDGESPNLPAQGTDLNFYGTTQYGGDAYINCGVVYKATAAGKIGVLHNFAEYPNDGCQPIGVLVQGNDGDFYGTTYGGGTTNNNGTVFKISSTGAYTLLYSFTFGNPSSANPYDARHPVAGLTLGTDGNLYGVGEHGGTADHGAIFEITPTGTETVLHNFCAVNCADGMLPTTPMVLHTDGKFYGNTAGNSNGGESVFYSFDVELQPFVKLVTWSAKDGATAEILGQGFTGTSGVSFNGTAASFKVVSDTYLTATVPAGATTGSVSVATSTGVLTSDRIFLVVPEIAGFSPPSGPIGTPVTISGSGFTGATAVKFRSKAAKFTVNSDSQITATVPSGAKTGKISVTTPGGVATSTESFTVT